MDMKNKTGAQIFKETMDKRQPLQTVVGANIHCSDQSGSLPTKAKEIEECLSEAVNLMEDIRVGAYKPDSFTTQPWKRILSDNTTNRKAPTMTEDPKTVELRRIDRRIEAVEDKLEELTQQRNQYRETLDKLYTEQLDLETS